MSAAARAASQRALLSFGVLLQSRAVGESESERGEAAGRALGVVHPPLWMLASALGPRIALGSFRHSFQGLAFAPLQKPLSIAKGA